MDWENKLKELGNYNIAFEIRQGYYHISIMYQDSWDIIMPENENIYLEKRNGTYHYIAATESVSIDDMFECVDNTINYNKDLEKKLELFKQKTAELQELFAKENYERLKTIEFVFPMQKKTRKKKAKETLVEELPNSDANSVSTTDKHINSITSSPTNYNDLNDEVVVTMQNDFIEELEK